MSLSRSFASCSAALLLCSFSAAATSCDYGFKYADKINFELPPAMPSKGAKDRAIDGGNPVFLKGKGVPYNCNGDSVSYWDGAEWKNTFVNNEGVETTLQHVFYMNDVNKVYASIIQETSNPSLFKALCGRPVRIDLDCDNGASPSCVEFNVVPNTESDYQCPTPSPTYSPTASPTAAPSVEDYTYAPTAAPTAAPVSAIDSCGFGFKTGVSAFDLPSSLREFDNVKLNKENPIVNGDGSAIVGECTGDEVSYVDSATGMLETTYVDADGAERSLSGLFYADDVNGLFVSSYPNYAKPNMFAALCGAEVRLSVTCGGVSNCVSFTVDPQNDDYSCKAT